MINSDEFSHDPIAARKYKGCIHVIRVDVARGMSFKTHASLLAAGASGKLRCLVSGAAFSAFLRERGYGADEMALYIAAARVAIRNVMEAEPRLSRWGYGVGRPTRKPEGKWENAKEHHARFLAEREQLLSDGPVEEFLRGLALVQLIAPIKTINRRSGSYGLKHRAENLICIYPSGTTLGPAYVANGSLIAAAVHAGFTYKTFLDDLGYDDVNVAFNMSQTHWTTFYTASSDQGVCRRNESSERHGV